MAAFERAALVLIAALLFAGCGYHIAGRGAALPGGVTEMRVPVFSNETAKPDIEGPMTEAFVAEMVNTVRVSYRSEIVMTGVITGYDLKPVSFTGSDVNIEYRLTITLSVDIKRGEDVLWKDENITDYEDFPVNALDVAATEDAERAAMRKLARDTARLVKERMLTGL